MARRAGEVTPASLRDDIRRMGKTGWLVYAIDRALDRLTGGRAGLCLLRFYLQPVPDSSLLPPRSDDPVSVGPIAADRVPEAAFDRPRGPSRSASQTAAPASPH